MAAPQELILNGDVVQSAAADNAIATASKAATANARHFVSGIAADYSVAVALIKTVTLKLGGVAKLIYRWDFSKGPFLHNFPVPIHGDYNAAVSVELEASGTGGTTGRVAFWVSSS